MVSVPKDPVPKDPVPKGWASPRWEAPSLDGAGCFITLNGASTTGKTYSALRLATGFARAAKGEIAAIDTEARRMSHYADRFRFRVFDMAPPFHPMRFAIAAEDAERRGFAALVIDSFSLEWIGEGGVLSMFDAEIARRVAKDDRALPDDVKAGKFNQVGWKVAKAPHTAMKLSLMQRRIPVIFCLRAEKKTKLPGEDGGKAVDLGWVASQDERWLYEWTISWTFDPETPGVPRRDIKVKGRPGWKCEQQHSHLFPDRKFITEQAGEGLWRWAHGQPFGPDWLRQATPGPDTPGPDTPRAATAAAPNRPESRPGNRPATRPDPQPQPGTPPEHGQPEGRAAGPVQAGVQAGAAASAADIFPGDLPSGDDGGRFANAGAFLADLKADLLRQRTSEHLRLLLNRKPVRRRLDILAQDYPALHREALAAVARRTAELGAPP